MQTTERAFLGGHVTSSACRYMAGIKTQRAAAATLHAALAVTFTAYGRDTLKRTETLKYLG